MTSFRIIHPIGARGAAAAAKPALGPELDLVGQPRVSRSGLRGRLIDLLSVAL